jgi:large subunit ribosomal protein L35
MSKLKTRRSAAKRFGFTGSGKIKRRAANHRHYMTGKPQKRKVAQRRSRVVSAANAKQVRLMLPHGG